MHFPSLGCCSWEIFYSGPAMNIILNHTATESFKSSTEIPVIKKAILHLALRNLEGKSPRG